MRARYPAYGQGVEARGATSIRDLYRGKDGSNYQGCTIVSGHVDLGANPISVIIDESMDWRGRLLLPFMGMSGSGATPFSPGFGGVGADFYDATYTDSYGGAFYHGIPFATEKGWNGTDPVGPGMARCPMKEQFVSGQYRYTNDFLLFADSATGSLRFAQRRIGGLPAKPDYALTYVIFAMEQAGPTVVYP